jgi:SSS family solute:Na+ symporter
METSLLGWLDWTVIVAYFLGVAAIAYRSSKKQNSATDYFLGGRNIGWFAIGASLFASNIGSEHIVGLAGQGASTGLAMAHYELHAWLLLMLGWVFVPFYYQSGIFTMPEFLERRFNATARWILSLVSLSAYVLTKVSVTVYAGALVFQALLPTTFGSPENAFWVGALSTVVLTGLYTVFGGLRAVLYTDAAQAVILLFGAVFILLLGLHRLGGWGELQAFAGADAARFALWRPLSDPDFPWAGVLFASPIVGLWYWCTDQYIVQRTLAAKDLRTARRGAIFGSFLKISPVMIFLVPGLIGAALHHKGLISIPLRADGTLNGDMVFPTLVTSLLPVGIRGLVVAGLLAALMSSLSSLFNSSASLFTVDIYQKLRPDASQREVVRVGRTATAVVVVLGLLWIPVMKLVSSGGLYQYLQNVQGYLAPSITAVFLLGLFWKRCNSAGAVWGLSLGFLMGMGKLTCQAFFSRGGAGGKLSEPAALAALADFNWLYASAAIFVLSVAVMVVASLLTPPQSRADLANVTYASLDHRSVRSSWNRWDVLASVAVAGLILMIYLYFSFWV